ncbi:MAG: hypothetical protein E5W70_32070 [Mesorhizobium sp.]|nr:MAG: hypothetical protein E5W70_32070 [Mesorhizobium sp.]
MSSRRLLPDTDAVWQSTVAVENPTSHSSSTVVISFGITALLLAASSAPKRCSLTSFPNANEGKNFINGLMKRLHPQGAHPGLSDEDDSTFRLHIVLLSARLLLTRYDAMVSR